MQTTHHRYRRSALAIAMAILQLGSIATPSLAQDSATSIAPEDKGTPLTLTAAIELAINKSPDLAVARREAEASEGAVMQGQVFMNPALSYQVEDAQRSTRITTLQISQPFELGGKRAARIDAAERSREIALAGVSSKMAEIRAQVTAAFFDVIAAQERVQLAQSLEELARQASDAAAKRVLAGKISPVEETKARVAEAGVRTEVVQAKSELTVSRQRLAALWGDASPKFLRAEGSLDAMPSLPSEGALRTRMAESPVLKKAQLEIARRKAISDLEQARRVPDLTVSLGVKRDEQLGRDQTVVGLSIPFPIFDSNRGNLLEALKREDKAREESIAVQSRLSLEVMEARGRLEAARDLAQALQRDVLPGAQSAYAAATKGFQLGKFSFLDVLDAQRTLFQARLQYLRALADTHRFAADIDRLLSDALSTPAHAVAQP